MIIQRTIYSDDYSTSDLKAIKDLLDSTYTGMLNYETENWETKPHSFLYVLLVEKRFSRENGGLVMVEDNGWLCGVSGFNRSAFNPEVYILGVRTLIRDEFKHKLMMSNYFVPQQLEEIRGKAKMVVFLFDLDNHSSLYTFHKKGKLNLFLKNKLDDLATIWGKLQAVPFPVFINNCNQNALYMKIDDTFAFDWGQMRSPNV
jgi:hypothetical protein